MLASKAQRTIALWCWCPPKTWLLTEKTVFAKTTCLNRNYSKLWRTTPDIFFRNCTDVRSLREYCMKLPECCTISDCDPPEKVTFTKSLQYSTPPCTKSVRGWWPGYNEFFRGSNSLPVERVYMRENIRQGAHGRDRSENLIPLGGQI